MQFFRCEFLDIQIIVTACQYSACVLKGYRACPVLRSNTPDTESGQAAKALITETITPHEKTTSVTP